MKPTPTEVKLTDYAGLNRAEKKIYDSIMIAFPATSHESALDKALQGGVNWQFYPR
jgi:hypothetical protein